MSIIISNAFKVIEGRPVTSSRIVADYFGKIHKNVMRDIAALIEKTRRTQPVSKCNSPVIRAVLF